MLVADSLDYNKRFYHKDTESQYQVVSSDFTIRCYVYSGSYLLRKVKCTWEHYSTWTDALKYKQICFHTEKLESINSSDRCITTAS